MTDLYANSSSFNTAVFAASQDNSQISWIGLMSGLFMVDPTVPPGNGYKFQATAIFGSGSGEQEHERRQVIKKHHQFLSTIAPKKENPKKVVQTFGSKFKDHPYARPVEIKHEPPKPFDESGNVTGIYSFQHAPWPSHHWAYLSHNLQMSSSYNVYNLQIVEDPSNINASQYAAHFSVADFVTTGLATHYTNTNTYSLAPNATKYFNFTVHTF